MNEAMWFVLGVLCGATMAFLWCKRKRRHSVQTPTAVRREREKATDWVATRNFLYYDGTEMPVIKENGNEQ